jgi:hypothetical protein
VASYFLIFFTHPTSLLPHILDQGTRSFNITILATIMSNDLPPLYWNADWFAIKIVPKTLKIVPPDAPVDVKGYPG